MPIFTVQRQRANTRATAWHTNGAQMHIEAPDAVGAAFIAARRLRVLPKVERLLLWEGANTSTAPRIFHSGS